MPAKKANILNVADSCKATNNAAGAAATKEADGAE